MDRKIIHITEGLGLSLGGTTQFIMTLCESLAEGDMKTEIWLPGHNEAWSSLKNKVLIRQFKVRTPKFIKRCKKFHTTLKKLNPKPALVHQHGLWLDPYRVAARFCRKNQIPHIISLHGMLEPWSLKQSQWKKRLAWVTFQSRDIQLASCLHVATQREAENVRRLGIRTRIAVIPNGIQIEYPKTIPNRQQPTGYPELSDKKIILFLGRIHPVKALDFFAKVWQNLAKDYPNWQWVIAGPDENHYQSELGIIFKQLGITDSVTFVGPVAGEQKTAMLRAAELLILPSYLESFGIVVLEALNEGIPVMASTNCPWSDLETYECGWWLEPSLATWESSLRKIMCMNHETLKEFGIRGKAMVRERYSHKQLVDSMTMLYNELLYQFSLKLDNSPL